MAQWGYTRVWDQGEAKCICGTCLELQFLHGETSQELQQHPAQRVALML